MASLILADEPEPFGIVIHGGAGVIERAELSPEDEREMRRALTRARDAGYRVLDGGGTALDAVEAAIVVLEDSPRFNAGRGSVLTHEGAVEMDASIMDGDTGAAGAVAAVRTPKNPIRAARRVMTDSPHVMLVGRGADAFIKEKKLPTAPQSYFKVERREDQLRRVRQRGEIQLDHGGGRDQKLGTVGAAALDKHGNLAAGTSTGGMTNKRWGRVGDSPIIGAGTWARNATCAVSGTGHGEYFIREAAAHSVSARMELAGQSLAEAMGAVIERLKEAGGAGGLIAIDAAGTVVTDRNTPGMYRAWRTSRGQEGVAIWDQ